jgi:hypothetical protein
MNLSNFVSPSSGLHSFAKASACKLTAFSFREKDSVEDNS